MPLSNAAGCTPAGPGPAAPPDDEQYRGRPLPGGASDRGLTRRQGREKACVFFGEETAAGPKPGPSSAWQKRFGTTNKNVLTQKPPLSPALGRAAALFFMRVI